MISEYFQKNYLTFVYNYSIFFYDFLYEFSEYCVENHILF